MMKLSEQIRKLAPFGVTSKRMLNEWADEAAKLSQAVNDKDTELFESQELVEELLEALEWYVNNDDTNYGDDQNNFRNTGRNRATEAIRKAKGE